VISVVQRWQSEQQAVDEVRASLAEAEARLDEAVLEGADLGDRSMVARLLDLPEAQVRKTIAGARRAAKHRASYSAPYRQGAGSLPGSWRAGAVGACHFESRPGAVLATC
jgi:hypothetical protein